MKAAGSITQGISLLKQEILFLMSSTIREIFRKQPV